MSDDRPIYEISDSDNQTDRINLARPIDEQVEEQFRRIIEKSDCPFKLRIMKRECKSPRIPIQTVSHGTEISGN